MLNLNGRCAALYKLRRRPEAEALLKELAAQADKLVDVEARLEFIRSLQMMSKGSSFRQRWQPGPHRGNKRTDRAGKAPDAATREERRAYLEQALALMQTLILQEPENEKVQARRVELLMHAQRPALQRQLLEEGQNMESLFQELLHKYPANQLIRRSFVQWVVRPFGRRDVPTLELAARFARSLLADDPGNTELLMLYIAVRDRLSAALASAGQGERARRENEMTLGVISLITTRADYTPEMRERLAMLVSMHPQADADRTQQEAEISLLLESMDEKRMQEIRQRIKSMRARRPHRGAHRHPRHKEKP